MFQSSPRAAASGAAPVLQPSSTDAGNPAEATGRLAHRGDADHRLRLFQPRRGVLPWTLKIFSEPVRPGWSVACKQDCPAKFVRSLFFLCLIPTQRLERIREQPIILPKPYFPSMLSIVHYNILHCVYTCACSCVCEYYVSMYQDGLFRFRGHSQRLRTDASKSVKLARMGVCAIFHQNAICFPTAASAGYT